jgi:hypothetical protein
MAIQIRWLEPGILLYTLQFPFSWAELHASIEQALTLAQEQPEREVGTLLDVRGLRHIPFGALSEGLKIVGKKPTNANLVVVVGASPTIRAFHSIVRTLYPNITRYVFFADNIAEGLTRLRSQLGLTPMNENHSDPVQSVARPYPTPEFKQPITTHLFEIMTADRDLIRRWLQETDSAYEDEAVLYITEAYVKALPRVPHDWNHIEWLALITELRLYALLLTQTEQQSSL